MAQRSTAYRIEYSPEAEGHLRYLPKPNKRDCSTPSTVNLPMSRRSKHAIERKCAPIRLPLGNFVLVIFGCIMMQKNGHGN